MKNSTLVGDATAQRKIIHCDCDCFYAAVEMRDDPSLAQVPLAVGGSAERRGVVATCNYQAREFGIHSAMPMGQALRLCPSLVVMPPDFTKYRSVSEQIRNIFHTFTDKVEPLSLDEAFLDVSETTTYSGSATLMAQALRQQIKSEVGIIVSAGVAPNKFLAKIASDWNKPDGLFVITPEQIDGFVEQLSVGKLFGVGKVTEKKLNDLGVSTCGELREVALTELTERFGVMGQRLYELCRGVDVREVRTDRRRKSLSVETTFVTDLLDANACVRPLGELFEKLSERYAKLNSAGQADSKHRDFKHGDSKQAAIKGSGGASGTRQFLKMRFDDFTVTTIERRLDSGWSLEAYQQLCEEAWQRKSRPVRLLGIGVRFANVDIDDSQYSLFE
ncbi:MAG: DNA polymerase IV [Porticoccaceae bacterium]|nr:DNA polymerase IV [Porticoccaceae bacterium]